MTQISELSITNFKSGAIIDRLERALSETINHISLSIRYFVLVVCRIFVR